MSEFTSPLINSARLPKYSGHVVRIAGEILRRDDADGELLVKASDGGEVRILLSGMNEMPQSKYMEIVGQVTESNEIRAHSVTGMGDNLDLALVDFVVEKLHDPRFSAVC